MLNLKGKDEVIRNVYRVARAHDKRSQLNDYINLRKSFLKAIGDGQPEMPINYGLDPFITDESVEDQLSKAFDINVILNDLNQDSVIGGALDKRRCLQRIQRCRSALNDLLMHDEDLNFVFGLVVHSIFIREAKNRESGVSAHGGSSSGSIGAIWLTVNDKISHADLREMFVHELTHVLLFIDELNYYQFDYEQIAKSENFARSAILLKKRPLDKVIHSIVVATELLLARYRFLGEEENLTVHPDSRTIARNTLTSISSVFELPNIRDITSDHLLDMTRDCAEWCELFADGALGTKGINQQSRNYLA